MRQSGSVVAHPEICWRDSSQSNPFKFRLVFLIAARLRRHKSTVRFELLRRRRCLQFPGAPRRKFVSLMN